MQYGSFYNARFTVTGNALEVCPGDSYGYLNHMYMCKYEIYILHRWGRTVRALIDPIIHCFCFSRFSTWHHAMQKEEHGKNDSTKQGAEFPNCIGLWVNQRTRELFLNMAYTANAPNGRISKAMSSSARLGKPVGSANRGERSGYPVISSVGRFWGSARNLLRKNWAVWIQVWS